MASFARSSLIVRAPGEGEASLQKTAALRLLDFASSLTLLAMTGAAAGARDCLRAVTRYADGRIRTKDPHGPPSDLQRHQGCCRRAPVRRRAAGSLSHRSPAGLCRPAHRAPVQGRPVESRPTCSIRRCAATCCAASRPASCCRRRMRSTANSGSSGRCTARVSRSREPHLLCDDESVVGTAFYVMGFVEGRVFWEPHMPASNPTERAAVFDAMNATLARLHSFDPAELGLERLRQGRKLHRPAGRSLVEAVSRVRDRADRGDGSADALAAGAPAAGSRRRGWCMATTGSTT